MTKPFARHLLISTAVAVSTSGCSAVLGIEDWSVDGGQFGNRAADGTVVNRVGGNGTGSSTGEQANPVGAGAGGHYLGDLQDGSIVGAAPPATSAASDRSLPDAPVASSTPPAGSTPEPQPWPSPTPFPAPAPSPTPSPAPAPPPVCTIQGVPNVDPTGGIFTSPNGDDNGACGNTTGPCRTVNRAITQALANGRAFVYLAPGTYAESVHLAGGVTLQGGLLPSPVGDWQLDCDPNAVQKTRIAATSNVTAWADHLGGLAGLIRVTLASKAPSAVAPGESLYGVFATGSTTQLFLEGVTIEIAAASKGGDGAGGSRGLDASGTCFPGTGSPGNPGQSGSAPPASTFASAGFTPSAGFGGRSGGRGGAGIAGSPPSCVTCVECGSSRCAPTRFTGVSCGTLGSSGCGGSGGSPGDGGLGGGASVAMFLWDASAQVYGSHFTSGNGGAGGAGGIGGSGGGGAGGSQGAAGPMCGVRCKHSGGQQCLTELAQGAPGGVGGPGGGGGGGGTGAGGAGGFSIAIVRGGSASASVSQDTVLMVGIGGAEGRGGTPGIARPIWP